MASRALERFWRGLREPWDLLGQMRREPRLWGRYWRTVLLQAALTLVAGGVVFWVGKQGAEAWSDAFGPEDVPAAGAAPVAGGSKTTDAASAPETPSSGSAHGASGAWTSPPAPRAPSRTPPGKAAPSPPAAPPPPPAAAPPEATNPPSSGAPVASKPPTGEEDEDDSADDEEQADSNLEEKVKALQTASPEERGKRTADLVAAALQKAKTETTRAKKHAERQSSAGGDAADELKEEREEVTEKIGDLTLAAEALARETPSAGQTRKARRHLERELDGVEKDQKRLEKKGAQPLTEAEKAKLASARAALEIARRHERGLAGRLGAVLALLAAIYASLGIAQTGILALSRDFHDALSRDLSLLVHVAPEDPPMRPKIRLDLPWVRRKAGRRAQFFLGFLPGTVLITIFGRLVPPHRTLTTVLTAIWAAYWWMVMTAGQSARAWTPPETTPRPWYLRAWFWLSDRVFVFGWWGRIWERFARRFYGPSERVEEQPFEFAGLSLSRALLLVPVVKLLFRPIFSVAAAHLLVEHAATARLPVPVSAAEVEAAAARAPDADARKHSGVTT
jgi:hypothetical protein